MPELVLASASPFRRAMLQAAGLAFAVVPAQIDERGLENAWATRGDELDASQLALALAVAKGQSVSNARTGALVIGCDQVLAFEGAFLSKAEDTGKAKQQLSRLRGRTHELHSAVCLSRGGEVVWKYVDIARMTMRNFSDAFLDGYAQRMGARLCQTVGAYEIEGEGIQLFERVEGDHFSIIGLPLLPLLGALRDLKVLAQ